MLENVLEDESCILIDCFILILWKQIPQNFRQFVLEKKAHDGITSFNIDSDEIKCEER